MTYKEVEDWGGLLEVDGVKIGGQSGVVGQVGEDEEAGAVGPGVGEVFLERTLVEGGAVGGVVFDDVDNAVGVDDDVFAGGEPLVVEERKGRILGTKVGDGLGKRGWVLENRGGGDGSWSGVEEGGDGEIGDELGFGERVGDLVGSKEKEVFIFLEIVDVDVVGC